MQRLHWRLAPEPSTRRVCNMPALIRQTARKDT